MKGSVTISIEDFDKLRTADDVAEATNTRMKRAARELEVFLSFLVTRENIQEYVDEFNRQSSTCRINVEDGRAKIVFRNEQEH